MREPGQIDFGLNRWVAVVDLVEESKRQLIDDPNFNELGYIPDQGITIILPAILSASHIFTMVLLGFKKSNLPTRVLLTEVPHTSLPATIIRWHGGTLFCDRNLCPDFV